MPRFNCRIGIERRVENHHDEFGEPLEYWEEIAARWASVRPVSGSEGLGGNQQIAEVTHTVRMASDRQTRSIGPKMRLKFKSDPDRCPLEVLRSYDLNERRMEVEVMCKESV